MRFNLLAKFTAWFPLLWGTVALNAQDIADTLFTVGTSVEDTDADGATWNYVLWQAEDPTLLRTGEYAIYRKAGPPESVIPYTLQTLVKPRNDAFSIRALLHRAEVLGDDPYSLEEHLDGLFENLLPIVGLSLEEKLGSILAGAQSDPDLYSNLLFLARRHPSVAMMLGVAHTDAVEDGVEYTYEIRRCPQGVVDADSECATVVGRLTITGGEVLPLPPPGIPVEVPYLDGSGDRDARNNLVARLRWATPNDLRRRSLLQFGFNLYRMSEEEAIADGFHKNPPTGAELRELALDSGHSTTLVNEAPVLVDPLLDETKAVDIVADPDTFYYIDDNDRFAPGGTPFANGEVYYYFLTALDVLLRDGESSEGTAVLMCDTLPPPPPRSVVVTNEYSWDETGQTNYQHFKVRWDPSDLSQRETPESVVAYRVYRWLSIEEMQQNAGQPDVDATSAAGGLVGIVGAGTTEFIDNGSNAPFLSTVRHPDGTTTVDQSYAGKTFWYTLRAVDESACDGNLSGNSAPAFGVLRDRRGPPKPSGEILTDCLELILHPTNEGSSVLAWEQPPDEDFVYLGFIVDRVDPRVDFAEFAFDQGLPEEFDLGTHAFPSNSTDALSVRIKISNEEFNNHRFINARVLSSDGKSSNWVTFDYSHPVTGMRGREYTFLAEVNVTSGVVGIDCDTHTVPETGGPFDGPTISVNLTDGTEEYKVYRRVDDGALTMIAQGLASFNDAVSVAIEDQDLPLNGGKICYFAQLFDEHGNPSPMVRIGCIETDPRVPLPTPMLAAPENAGNEGNPDADLAWFCPPYGVERFRLWVSVDDTEELPNELGPQLRPIGSPVDFGGETFYPYETVRVSSEFGDGPEFAVRLEAIEFGREYTFFVEAMGSNDATGDPSNEQSYRWMPDADDTVSGPNVPWPARPLPNVNGNFHPDLEAIIFPDGVFDGGLVRIGRFGHGDKELPIPSGDGASDFPFPVGMLNPIDSVFKNLKRESLMPFVLYRYQVTNADFPQVSGDIYQVSPLMEAIASEALIYSATGETYYQNHDKFIAAAAADPKLGENVFDLFVKDTSPLIRDAAYRYLIVRFDPATHEIVEVIPTNTITTP